MMTHDPMITHDTMIDQEPGPLPVAVPSLAALAAWFFVMLAVGRLGVLNQASSAVIGGIMLGLVMLQIAAFRNWGTFRAWTLGVDLRFSVLFLGIADIVMILGAALWLNTGDPGSLEIMGRHPLSLLPTFVLPLVIGSHLLMMARLWEGSRAAGRVRRGTVANIAC